MPPEQASGVVSSLGPCVDVYALGAVLYEALTGRPPFQAPDVLQTLMMVLTRDPLPPRVPQPAVPRGLETVCLKCLAESPAKRYPTAEALADDLRRFLAGEPVLARTAGRAERAAKWARRRPWQAAAAGLLAAGVVGLAGGLAWVGEKNREVRAANDDELTGKNGELGEANRLLEKSRGESEALANYALGAMEEYHFDLSDKLRELPQGERLRVEVLARAGKRLDELCGMDPRRALVWEYLMHGYSRLGGALAQVGDLAGAAAAYEKCRAAAARLEARNPGDAAYPAARATAGLQLAAALDRLARPGAAALRDEGARAAAELLAERPRNPEVLKLNLIAAGNALAAGVADPASYEAGCRRLAEAEPDAPRHAISAADWDLRLAAHLAGLGRAAEAETALATARAALERLPDPDSPPARLLRASWHEAAAAAHDARGRPADVDAEYLRALAVYEGLARDFPDTPNHRRRVVTTLMGLGTNARHAGKPADAAGHYGRARELAAGLARDFPADDSMKKLLEAVDKSAGPP